MQVSCRAFRFLFLLQLIDSAICRQGACGSGRLLRNPEVEGKVKVETMTKRQVGETAFCQIHLSSTN